MITKYDAVLALVPDVSFGVTSESEIIWHEEPQQKPTEEQIQAKLAELQAEYEANQYQRDRQLEYPTIEELVVALYDEEDKQAIIERRNAVKAKYPKPE